MMYRINRSLIVCLVAVSVLLPVCNDLPNPFLDTTRARASVATKSFNDGDTVQIFSKETFSVAVYLREHIREVRINVDNNRLWPHSDTVFHSDDFTGELIGLSFSFYDTGWQKIEVISFLNGGDSVVEAFSLYAKSPLYQKSITNATGDTLYLKTQPVYDEGMLYVWDFHDGTSVKEYSSEVKHVLKNALSSSIGELYVTDPVYRSPSIPFAIVAGNVSELELKCVNDSTLGDSVYTGEKELHFTVQVNGTTQLRSIAINGMSFINSKVQAGAVLVSKALSGLDTLDGPMEAVVVAVDNSGRTVRKTFYIYYDELITPDPPVIIVSWPVTTNDTGYVIDQHVNMYGTITGVLPYDRCYVHFILNGIKKSTSLVKSDSTDWFYKPYLAVGWNLVYVQLSPDSTIGGSVLAATKIALKCDTSFIDSEAPVIGAIKVDGVAVGDKKRFVSRNDKIVFRIFASDNKKVAFVTINGVHAKITDDGLNFELSQSLAHIKSGTQFIICAKDSTGNGSCDTVTGIFNRIPRFQEILIPLSLKADSLYQFTIKSTDDDGDDIVSTVTITSATVDTVLTVKNGVVHWMPSIKDTGLQTIHVNVSDEFYENIDTTLSVNVLYLTGKPIPVSWRTKGSDLPGSVIVGGTPLSIVLKVDSLTGKKPFSYLVFIDNPAAKLYEDTSAYFTWVPARGDAGLRSLRFIVRDILGYEDTLDILLKVVAQPAAKVWFVEQAVTMQEGSTRDDSVEVRLSTALESIVSIPYHVEFKSASSLDIAFDSIGTITFEPGDTIVKFPVPLFNDTLVEITDEEFIIVLSAQDSVVVDQGKSTCAITIKDDEFEMMAGVMLQPDYKITVPESAHMGDYPAVVLTKVLPIDLIVTVKPTSASTAIIGSDYTIASFNIVVKAGKKFAPLGLLLIDDRIKEETKLIELEIIAVSDLSLAYISNKNITTVEVFDND